MEGLEQRKKIVIMLAIMSAMLFAALNQTIVGTALPKIIADLGGMEYYGWVFTIYILTSSVTSILVGKLSDIYGRKVFILVGIGIFTVGSFLSGLSFSIIELIVYRAIQGFGAGMIMSTSFSAIGDLFVPRERGRWQGLMSSVFGVASVFGPTLGGWIVDNGDWHWIFWVFLPFGIVAFLMILFLFPKMEKKPSQPIDYFGSILITLTIVPILLTFTWGGSKYEWSSLPIVLLITASVCSLLLFIAVERRVVNPVLPLQLFKIKEFTIANTVGLFLGFGMFGTMIYLPFFIQGVLGESASKSGLMIMPLTISMVIASAIIGSRITVTGSYKRYALVGFFIMGVGLVFMSFMTEHTSTWFLIINIIIVGFGLGMSMPVLTLVVQNAVNHSMLGVATASVQLFRQMGGTIGVGILGTVMNRVMINKMDSYGSTLAGDYGETGERLLVELQNPQLLISGDALVQIKAELPSELYTLFESLAAYLRSAMGSGLSIVYIITAAVVISGLLLTFFLEEKPLRETQSIAKEEKIS